MKKTTFIIISLVFLMTAVSVSAGFDQFGYNRDARVFVGTCHSWHQGKFSSTDEQATAYCGIYDNDKLVMKWNAEWDRGNAENWVNPPYDAYLNNEWNGKVSGGSGETEIVKIKWVGACGSDGTPPADGGYCIWGQFEVLMDHYTGRDSLWLAHSTPNGYGAN